MSGKIQNKSDKIKRKLDFFWKKLYIICRVKWKIFYGGVALMDEISIVLSGEAGKGLKTVEEMVTKILAQDGYNIYA